MCLLEATLLSPVFLPLVMTVSEEGPLESYEDSSYSLTLRCSGHSEHPAQLFRVDRAR